MSHHYAVRPPSLILSAIVCFFGATNLFAQATGRIGGSVVDASGANVPGATTIVKNLETGLTRTVQSNDSGIFEFPDLPIGQYQLQVTKQGFETEQTDNIQVVTGQVVFEDLTTNR